jgi:hypothetical protein
MSGTKEHDSSGIEVVHELPNNLHSSLNVSTSGELANPFAEANVDQHVGAAEARPPAQYNGGRLKRTIIWLVGAIVFLIIFVIVVGVVLGAKLDRKPPAPSSTSTSSNSATTTTSSPTPAPTSPRRGTAISVTGWRNGSDYSIRLFYQGNDQYLRIIGFESSNSSWSAPTTFAQAKAGTPIAAASFNTAFNFESGPSVWNLSPCTRNDSTY